MATTVRTRLDLITAVLQDWNLCAQGESPSASDAAYVGGKYDNLLEELRDDGLVYWTSNAIPYEVFEAIIQWVGIHIAKGYGFPVPSGEQWNMYLDAIRRRIRRRTQKRTSQLPTPYENF